jgi:hypothetical protein
MLTLAIVVFLVLRAAVNKYKAVRNSW